MEEKEKGGKKESHSLLWYWQEVTGSGGKRFFFKKTVSDKFIHNKTEVLNPNTQTDQQQA